MAIEIEPTQRWPISARQSKALINRLPQGEAFRFIEQVLEITETSITALAYFSPESDYQRAHFPGNPVVPGAIITEALFQAAIILCQTHRRGGVVCLRDVTVKFSRPLQPGPPCKVVVERLLDGHSRLYSFKGEVCDTKGKRAAQASFRGLQVSPTQSA